MNANELADELDKFSELGGDVFFGMCADFVRQQQADKEQLEFALINSETAYEKQQAEIEALKDEVAMWKMSYENNIRMEDGYGLN